MASNTLDFETERLIVQIQREDLRLVLRSTQDPPPVSIVLDQLTALDVQWEELQLRESKHAGQVLQQSMYVAMLADSRAIVEERRHEQQAAEDRNMAVQLAGLLPPIEPPSVRQQITGGQFEDVRLTQLEETASESNLAIGGSENEQKSPFSENRSGQHHFGLHDVNLERYMAALSLDERHPAMECVVCSDSCLPSQTKTLVCGHIWCRGCLARLFEDAILNEGVWPPKCCRQEISVNDLHHILSVDLRNHFTHKSIEWSTPNRVYCFEPTCSTFISTESIQGHKAQCPVCSRHTCSECKSAYHDDIPCSGTAADDELLRELADTNGWQKCPGCQRFVEITHGCNHMTFAMNALFRGKNADAKHGEKID